MLLAITEVPGFALSDVAGGSEDGAIKTLHRVREGDRFSGLPTEGGNPGGGRVAEDQIPPGRRGPEKSPSPFAIIPRTRSHVF